MGSPMDVVPGITRTGGYFGRYARSGSKSSEQKFFNTSYDGDFGSTLEVLPGGGVSTSLCLIPQGAEEDQRIGRKCVITKILLRGYTFQKAITNTATMLRMLLILDTQCNGAYPAATDVLEGTPTVIDFNKLANSMRFRVLRDWFMPLPTDGAFALSTDVVNYGRRFTKFKYNKKCKIPLEFNGATGAITELRSNNLILMAIAVNNDTYTFSIKTRLRFSDS